MEKYDVIIIGSGIGGLTAAVLLAKLEQKKVLLLEQHFVPGGQTHDFTRRKDGNTYQWDVGVHYIGGMDEGYMQRRIFDYLTDGKLKWEKMPPVFEKFVYPDFTIEKPSDIKEYTKILIEKFPEEKDAIIRYFKDIKKAAAWFGNHIMSKAAPKVISLSMEITGSFTKKMALSTTKAYLDSRFKDEKLKAVLTSIWGDYGLPPSESAFAQHAIVVKSYFHGAFYPVGGAGEIAKTMIPIIEAAGGKVQLNTNVTEIIVENNIATGVKATHKKETQSYFAETIISNVGAYNTYNRLLKPEINIPFRAEVTGLDKNGLSSVTLYLGLKDSPEKIGIKGENYWLFADYDHDKMVQRQMDSDEININFGFLSFPSLKDPKAKGHTAELISFISPEFFQQWKGESWMKRDKSYYELKDTISNKLLAYAEKSVPGLSALVDYKELSTPLTMEYFTKWPNGHFYGIPGTPERLKADWISPKTPVKNLYLTGTDASTLGVFGALMGGIATVATMSAKGFFKVLKLMK